MKIEQGTFLEAFLNTTDKNYQRYLKQRYDSLNFLIRIEENDKILDAGCGDGVIIKLILDKKIKNIQIAAVDSSIKILNKAKSNFLNYSNVVKFVNADICNLPFPDDYFDKTICFHVIEHIKPNKLNEVLKELRRVTRKELFLGFPNKYSFLRLWEILHQEGIKGIISKISYFIKRNKPLLIEKPRYSNTPHIYYNVSYIKNLLKKFDFQARTIKKIYFPIKFLDISQRGLSVPFGHSIIIKSTKKQ